MPMRHMPSRRRESYIPKGSVAVRDKRSDAIAYVYAFASGKLAAAVFYGAQTKPIAHHSYRDEALRAKHVAELFEARQRHAAHVGDRRAEEKAFAHAVRVGDIFRTCWGYDQTNVEFFEVTKLVGAKMCELREIACASDERGGPQERIAPQSGSYLEPRYEGDKSGLPIRRLIQKGYSGAAHIKIDDVRSGSPWGTRGPGGIVIGAPASRTGSGWGH